MGALPDGRRPTRRCYGPARGFRRASRQLLPHSGRHDRPEQRRNAGDGQRVRRRQQGRHADPQQRANNRHAPATRPAPPEAEAAMVIAQEAVAVRTGRHDASLCPLSRRARPTAASRHRAAAPDRKRYGRFQASAFDFIVSGRVGPTSSRSRRSSARRPSTSASRSRKSVPPCSRPVLRRGIRFDVLNSNTCSLVPSTRWEQETRK